MGLCTDTDDLMGVVVSVAASCLRLWAWIGVERGVCHHRI